MVSHTRQILTLVIIVRREARRWPEFASLSLHEGIGEWSDATENRLGLGSGFPFSSGGPTAWQRLAWVLITQSGVALSMERSQISAQGYNLISITRCK
ncbi:hypothetical protein [Leptolyngbya iicbica]|uniref:Uncharacterized protein n=1 Tax=Leptolyngbya iicbica LK TaxID=2294035 RepID=A0A4Q7E515_9CYAN|nr:hypothetical protein [Leptolyngbya sp. LK]RZM77227.1 hypothetical protein DYY88_16400 [Leptolyngbya sp. LK]